jgi:hypothetical protein
LDWGSPTTAGAWSAHPLEAGLGTASANTHDASISDWQAVGSDATNIGLGVGPGSSGANKVLIRTDNALQVYDPTEVSGSHWGTLPVSGYYQNYSFFGGHANSAPINTNPPGGGKFDGNPNNTDQYFSGPYFWDHGNPNMAGSDPNAVPWIGDHMVGFNSPTDQQARVSFNKGGLGVDEVAFSVVGRSNSQTNNQSTVSSQWLSGGSNPSGIFEVLVQAYDNVNPTLGTLLFSYEVLVGGTNPAFGACTAARESGGQGLDQSVPVPCNDSPIIDVKGTKGVFNIRSIVISSTTDSAGFYLDGLYYDQAGAAIAAPEPTELFLIGGGLIVTALLAKRRGILRR